MIDNRDYSIEATTLYQTNRSQDIWSISFNVSAARALAIIAVLRAMSLFEGMSEVHGGFQVVQTNLYAFRTHGGGQHCDFLLFEFSWIMCRPTV